MLHHGDQRHTAAHGKQAARGERMTRHQGPYCGAKLLKRDGTCTLAAGWGTDHPVVGHCRKHLGSTPNQNRAAAREMCRSPGKTPARADGRAACD